MNRRQRSARPVQALALVATLVLSGLTGALVLISDHGVAPVDNNDVTVGGLANNQVFKDGQTVPFTLSITYETTDNSVTSCTFFVKKPDGTRIDVTPAVSVRSGTTNKCPRAPSTPPIPGPETVTSNVEWTVGGIADAATGGYKFEVDVVPSSGSSPITKATTNTFAIDNTAANLLEGQSNIKDGTPARNQAPAVSLNTLPDQNTDAAKLFGAGPYDVTIAISDEPFARFWRVVTCDTEAIIAEAPSASDGETTKKLAGITLASFPQTPAPPDDQNVFFSFKVQVVDRVDNTFTSATCYQVKADNLGPKSTVLAGAKTIYASQEITRTQCLDASCPAGTHFRLSDGGSGVSHDGTGASPAGLAAEFVNPATGSTISTSASGTGTSGDPYVLALNPAGVPPSTLEVRLRGTDNYGNVAGQSQTDTFSFEWDPDAPFLQRVLFDSQDPNCGTTFEAVSNGNPAGAGAEYCAGPYEVLVTIHEEFPARSGGAVTAPVITSPDNTITFGSPSSDSPTTSKPPGGVDVYTWRYPNVQVVGGGAVGPITFDVDLFEKAADGDGGRGISNTHTGLGFTLVGSPRVELSPATTIFNDEATLSVTEVAPQANGQCATLTPNAADGQFCAPGAGDLSVQLVAQDGSGPGLPVAFTKVPGSSTWTATWDPGQSSAEPIQLQVTRGTGGNARTAKSDPVTLVVDQDIPRNLAVGRYYWSAQDSGSQTSRHWIAETSTSTSKGTPVDGHVLVKARYDSFSAKQIKFRFVNDADRDKAEDQQRYIEYIYLVNADGNGHIPLLPEEQAVHLAKNIPLAGSTSTPATGCEDTSGNPRSTVWGANQVCYFLIETKAVDIQTVRRQSMTSIPTGQTFRAQLIIIEDNGDEGRTTMDNNAGQVKFQNFDGNFATPTLSPTVPEVGLTTTVRTKVTGISGNDNFARTDVWACLIRPINPAAPNADIDLPFPKYLEGTTAQPDCDLQDFPVPGQAIPGRDTAHARRFAVEQTGSGSSSDQGDRRITFSISTLLNNEGKAVGPGDEPVDELYLRVLFRDKYGNLRQTDHTSTGPQVFEIASYKVGQGPVRIQQTNAPTAQQFRENEGCFQPAGVNSQVNPCYRRLDYVPAPAYPVFTFPVIVRNDGNVEDVVELTWRHVAGQAGWSVNLLEAASATTACTAGSTESLDVSLPKPLQQGVPTEKRVLVCVQPSNDARADLTDPFKTLVLTAQSGNSEAITNPRIDLHLRARLQALPRGSVLVGAQATEDVAQEVSPDDRLFIPVQLANTGNTREDLLLGIHPTLSTGDGSGGTLCRFASNVPAAAEEDHIVLQLQTAAGSPIDVTSGRQLLPGQKEDLRVQVDVGRNVAASQATAYRCVFQLKNVGGATIPITPLEPTLRLTVVGVSEMKIIEVRGIEDSENDVTSGEVVHVVAPGQSVHDLDLYLENAGTVALEPQLSVSLVRDRFSLGGEWKGVRTSTSGQGAEINLETASQPFTLPISDAEDPTRLKDNTGPDGSFAGTNTEDHGPWKCLRQDDKGTETENTDERVVCHLRFRYRVPATGAIAGDQVSFTFAWSDPAQPGTPGRTTVKLVFDHVGITTVSSVTNRVIGTGQSTTLDFETNLIEGQRFDTLNQQSIPSEIAFSFTHNPTFACSVNGSGPNSFSQNQGRALFRVPVQFATGANAGKCFVDRAGTGPYTVKVPQAGTLAVQLTVREDNGSAARQVVPAHVGFSGGGDAVNRPLSASQLEVKPADEMNVNGSQYARFLFEPRLPGGSPMPSVLLSRGESNAHLQPFVACTLEGRAMRTTMGHQVTPPGGGGPVTLQWIRMSPAAPPPGGSWPMTKNANNQIQPLDADTLDVHGQLLRRSTSTTNPQATHVGNVHVYAWGDGTSLTPIWREGWNPLVLYIEDVDGDPALNSVKPTMEFQFLARDPGATAGNSNPPGGKDPISDRFQVLTTSTATSVFRPLGNGFYALDLFIPEGLTQAELGAKMLDDHPDQQTTSSTYDAWAIKMRVTSGKSRGGDDIIGDAFWRLSDLGLVSGTGSSLIMDGGIASGKGEINQRFGTDPATTTRTFIHRAVRFLGGPVAPDDGMSANGIEWTTGPGLQDLAVSLWRENSQPFTTGTSISNTDATNNREETADGYRMHSFTAETSAKPTVVFQPLSRVRAAGGGTQVLQPVDTGAGGSSNQYSTVLNLPDPGIVRFDWVLQLVVRDSQNLEINRMTGRVVVESGRQAAVSGLPMPLCMSVPAGATPDRAGDFDIEGFDPQSGTSLSNRRVIDLRAVPGLRPDRGAFAFTPFLVNTDGGVRHDATDTFIMRGKGLVSIDATTLPTSGEINVPIQLSISTVGVTPTSVTATLRQGGSVVDTATLTLDADGFWSGEVTPTSDGDHTLIITAEDAAGGVTEVSSTIDVLENAPARLRFTKPASVDGKRAMKPGGTIEATATDQSITADAVSLLRRSSSGSTPTGDPLDQNNVAITGLTTQTTPGSKTVTVTVLNETDDPVVGTVHVNVSGVEGDGFNDTLDSDGKATGTIELNEAGTATIAVQTNGTDGVDESFTVTVNAATTGGFQPVTSGVDVSCSSTTCTLRYTPGDAEDGDTLVLKLRAAIAGEDTVETNDTTILVDGTAPSVTLEIGNPKVTGTPTIVGSSTVVDVSATDGSAVESLIVSGLRGSTELGSRTITSADGSVALSELGLEEEGTYTVRVVARDIAGNEDTEEVQISLDATGPTVSNAALSRSGASLVVTAEAEDSAGVSDVNLFFRRPGTDTFTSAAMTLTDGTYRASVSNPGSTGTFRYYVQATDTLGNQGTLGSSGSPETFNLGDAPIGENDPPTVSITSPAEGARVSGTIDVTYTTSDPDGDEVTVHSVRAKHQAASDAIDLGTGLTTVPFDTVGKAEGATTITVEVTDGVETVSASVNVIVDNLPDAPVPCEGNEPLTTGKDVCITFSVPTSSDVQEIAVTLMRNGEPLTTKTLDPQTTGQYQTTFDLDEEGQYALRITKTNADGSTEEITSETFSVQASSIADVVRPLGRFIAVIVLGVLVVAMAAFAAFGRWN